MADLHRIEHATLGVDDLEVAVAFYTEALGLVELDRSDGVVYLGCGRDPNYDVALRPGTTGVEHFAVRATDAAVVERVAARLTDHDVPVHRTDGDEPGQAVGVRFRLPSGVAMEVVAVDDDRYQHYEAPRPGRGGQAPADLDHIQFLTPDVLGDLAFLTDAVGLAASELAGARDDPEIAFARCNTFHHDVALKSATAIGETAETSLHHLAFTYDSVDALVAGIDAAVAGGADFERGVGRHHGGNNLYAYLWAPGGNRIEFCTQMATLSRAEPEHAPDYETATTAWGPGAPETFGRGSGLVRSE